MNRETTAHAEDPTTALLDSAPGLDRQATGLWRTQRRDSVSYPEDGHDHCHAIEEDSFWFNHRNQIIQALITTRIPRRPLFDVGGGNGWVSKYLEQNGWPVVLVEPGERGVENARKRGLTHIIHGTIEDARMPPRSIHNFGLFDVLEHLPARTTFLNNLRSLAAADCHLAITVPAYRWLWSSADVRAGHHERYTRKRLATELGASGWRVLFTSYFFSVLPPAIWVGRCLPYKLRPDHDQPATTSSLRRQHATGRRVNTMLTSILHPEIVAISRRIALPFGASLCCVAVPA